MGLESARRPSGLGYGARASASGGRAGCRPARPCPSAERLKDAARRGAPARIAPEQICAIVALACERPEDVGVPLSHWSASDLAREAVRRGIIDTISPRSVGRFFKKNPTSSRISCGPWLTSKPDPDFEERCVDVCAVYGSALEARHTTRTALVDEMTGIQALERIAPSLPIRPGKVERREFEYVRHGTKALIAVFDVVTGTVADTRTEADFVAFLKDLLASAPPTMSWRASAASTKPRSAARDARASSPARPAAKAFLTGQRHRITFHFTPKHASWLNQIEIWFSILVRKLLRRASFASKADLKNRIERFIDYFNQTMAKPFRSTWAGRPLTR